MLKLAFTTFVVTSILLSTYTPLEASLLKIQKNGTVEINVLSAQDELDLSVPKRDSLEVMEISDAEVSGYSTVKIAKKDNKYNLEVTNGLETTNLDVTDFDEEIVEIEERPQVKKIKVGIHDNKFSVNQSNVRALTIYPLKVDSKTAEISVVTPTGEKYLSILPFDAVETLLKSGLITKIPDKKIEIVDGANSLEYKIPGEKVFSIFNVYDYSVPVTSNISASTGEIIYIDGPSWLKVLNFLFS